MYSVLLIDDEPHIIEALTLTVKWGDYGFHVGEAVSNALDALDTMGRCRFDLIITDIRMPQLNGIEFLRRVRELLPDVELLIISGYNSFEYARQAISLRVDAYILKPIDPDEIHEQLALIKTRLDVRVQCAPDERDYGSMTEIIRYIDGNYRKHITLKSISEKFFINTAYLGLRFKQVTGENFNRYINRLRIEYVKTQSRQKKDKMNNIIAAAGFRNHQYFYKLYQKIEGVPFSAFRPEDRER